MPGEAKQNCETCHYWRYEMFDGQRQCQWQPPALPFWAGIRSLTEEDDMDGHVGWTWPHDGQNCRAWTEREDKP
jgi:hypothetical protein